MSKKINLHLLILCGIFSQGIIAKSGESSNFLARQKRVITDLPNGNTPTPVTDANYLVRISRSDIDTCIGSILSHQTVLTSDRCFHENSNLKDYTIHAGVFAIFEMYHTTHNITSKAQYYGNDAPQIIDGVALITVDPLIVYSEGIEYIPLHLETLSADTLVTVPGWRSGYPLRTDPVRSRQQHSFNYTIMNHAECENLFKDDEYFFITDKHICISGKPEFVYTDIGTPLVLNRQLIGILTYKKQSTIKIYPEVYLDLERPEYNDWIREHTLVK